VENHSCGLLENSNSILTKDLQIPLPDAQIVAKPRKCKATTVVVANVKTFLLLVVTVANKTQFRLSLEEISRYYAVTASKPKDKDKVDHVTKLMC